MTSPQLSVIIPTYNESHNIIKLIQKVHKVCRSISHEIIIVDDNSPDNTAQTIITTYKNTPQVRCFIRIGERNLGASIFYGIQKSRGHIIVGMDADFNHNPALIPSLVGALRQADLAVASRFIVGGGMADRFRYIGSFLFNYILRVMLNFPITDNTSGYYAIQKKTLMSLHPKTVYHGYGEYHLRLVWEAQKQKRTFAELPTYYPLRFSGVSKSKPGSMVVTYFLTALRLRFS